MATIRLKYVNKFANKDRADTKQRYYFRVRGQKAIPLPGQVGSEEFMQAYSAALATLEGKGKAAPSGADLVAPGTVKALVVSYYATNSDWRDIFKQDTRDSRRRIIDKFCDKYGSFRVRQFTTAHLVKIMNKKPTPSARRNWLTTIKHVFGHAAPPCAATIR